MGFTGTLEKCKACDKTVYFVELVSADGVPYHKKCFKCSHCNGLLVVWVLFIYPLFFSMPFLLWLLPKWELMKIRSFTRIIETEPPWNLSYRWAAIPRLMEFYTANLITTSSSRRPVLLPRNSNPVRSASPFSFRLSFFYIFFELEFHGEGCSPPYFTFFFFFC